MKQKTKTDYLYIFKKSSHNETIFNQNLCDRRKWQVMATWSEIKHVISTVRRREQRWQAVNTVTGIQNLVMSLHPTYCLMLLDLIDDTKLNSNSYRQGMSDILVCDCGVQKATVTCILLHLNRHSNIQWHMNYIMEKYGCLQRTNGLSPMK